MSALIEWVESAEPPPTWWLGRPPVIWGAPDPDWYGWYEAGGDPTQVDAASDTEAKDLKGTSDYGSVGTDWRSGVAVGINGRPCWVLGNFFSRSGSTYSGPVTFVTVISLTSVAASRALFGPNSSGAGTRFRTAITTGNLELSNDGSTWHSLGFALAINTPYVLALRIGSDGAQLFAGDSTAGTLASGITSASFQVASRVGGAQGSSGFIGRLACWGLMYDAPSNDFIIRSMKILKARYGI